MVCHNTEMNTNVVLLNVFLYLMPPKLVGPLNFWRREPNDPSCFLSFFLSFSQEFQFTFCFCFRKERREAGLTVVVDSRRQPPPLLLLSSMSELQVKSAGRPRKNKYVITLRHKERSGPAESLLSSQPWCHGSPAWLHLGIPHTFPIVWPLALLTQI